MKQGATTTFIEPMMALRVSDLPPGDWLYEMKFDGYRALAIRAGKEVRLVSRNRTDFTNDYPQLADSLKLLRAKNFIIDGEIAALDSQGKTSFQLLQSYGIRKNIPLVYYAFDLLNLEGTDLRSRPLVERRKLLAVVLKKPPDNIRFSEELRGTKEELLRVARQFQSAAANRAGSTGACFAQNSFVKLSTNLPANPSITLSGQRSSNSDPCGCEHKGRASDVEVTEFFGRDETLAHLAFACAEMLSTGTAGSSQRVGAIAHLLAIHIAEKYTNVGSQKFEYRGGLPVVRLRKVEDYVRAHLTEDISIEKLAELAELSSFHFCRVFKQTTGMTPLRFVTRERMLKAQRLICETSRSLIEIALDVGYTSPSHFAQVFRRTVGMAPNEFRNAFSARIR